jgi:hypothetical protein
MTTPTARQGELLAYIIGELVAGRSPTVRGAALRLGVSSPATVARHLAGLRARGFLGQGWAVLHDADGRPFTLAGAVLAAAPTAELAAELAARGQG